MGSRLPPDDNFRREVWHEVIDAAERHNDPGTFMTFPGYEYSSSARAMLHRNVLFADGPEHTPDIAFPRCDTPTPAPPDDGWTGDIPF